MGECNRPGRRASNVSADYPADGGRFFLRFAPDGVTPSKVGHLTALVLSDPINRRDLLHEGWKDIAKVFVAAIVVDLVYQIMELRWFHPEEALIVATTVAFLPYLLLRGPANRIARHWQRVGELR
jgi:hypothetical protein